MSDITGSTNVEGVTFSWDINPDAETATVTASYAGVKLGSMSLTSTQASASVGGNVAGMGVTAGVTANWSADNITYSVKINPPVGKTKTYTGTLVHWS